MEPSKRVCEVRIIEGVCDVRTRSVSGAIKTVYFYQCGPLFSLTEAMKRPLIIEVSWPDR